MIPNLPIDDVSFDEIMDLVENNVRESQMLEYKRQPYGKLTDDGYKLEREHKREMLRDVCGMANAGGGYLILGIQEDPRECAEKIILIIDPFDVAKQMKEICLQGIQDPIQGLQIRILEPKPSLGGVILVNVPDSKIKPHMVSIHGRTGFYYRFDTSVQTMTLRHIEAAFKNNRRPSILSRLMKSSWGSMRDLIKRN